MADTGQGINVGDAVLTFLGDTTQLDLAFDRVATSAEVKMAAAADSVGQVGEAADVAAPQIAAMGPAGEVAGTQIAAGMKTAEVSIRGVSEQARVAEEMIGIRLPRGVNSFVARLPGVQGAISAAFSAGIVYFLVEALVQGSEKLSNWIANTFIFTQAMKDSDQAIKDQNKTLLDLAAQLAKDTEALDKFGKTQGEIKSDKVV